MTSSNSSATSNSIIPSKYVNALEDQDPKNPLWAYVKILNKSPIVGGGNKSWQCNFCDRVITGSYTRVKSHLLKLPESGVAVCKKVNADYLSELKKFDEEAIKALKRPHIPLPFETRRVPSGTGADSLIGQRRKAGPLEKAFNNERAQLTKQIARMFYSSGLSFHLARNPYYMSSYTFAASHSIYGYTPPGYNALRITLLQKEKANVERMLQPIKSLRSSKGASIVTDGWTNFQRRCLINFMAVSEGGHIFLKSIDGNMEYKDKHYMAHLFKEAIIEVGFQNVVQLITDNAAVCKATGLLIEDDYPHIFWTPCVVHTLNLALKNICYANNTERNEVAYAECYWISQIADDVSFIRNFIMNHFMRLAIFDVFVPLKLLVIADTRFASVIVMLKRFQQIKQYLQEMVISQEWNTYREDDHQRAATVKGFILDDMWWDKIDYIIIFTDPIYEMLLLFT